MKNKHFYSFLIETTEIHIQLGEMDLTSDERMHLLSLVDANIHSSVIGNILDNLPEEDKKIFLQNLSKENHEKTWEHLKIKIENAEDKIRKIINDTSRELLEDIKKAKKN